MAIKELSEQENKVAHLIANGLIAKEIADKLYISVHTVATHMRNIRTKIRAHNIADITRKYILSLEKPGDIFKAVLFLALQLSIIVGSPDMDLRRLRRSRNNSSKIVRLKSL